MFDGQKLPIPILFLKSSITIFRRRHEVTSFMVYLPSFSPFQTGWIYNEEVGGGGPLGPAAAGGEGRGGRGRGRGRRGVRGQHRLQMRRRVLLRMTAQQGEIMQCCGS